MASNAEVKRALLAAPMRKGKKDLIRQLSDWANFETGVLIPRYARTLTKLADAIGLTEDTTKKLLAEAHRDGWWQPDAPDPKRPDRVVMGKVLIPEDVRLLVKLGRLLICQWEPCGKTLNGRAGSRFCCARHRMAQYRLDANRNSRPPGPDMPESDANRNKPQVRQCAVGDTEPVADLSESDANRNRVTRTRVTEPDIIANKAQVTEASTSAAVGQISVEEGCVTDPPSTTQIQRGQTGGSGQQLQIPRRDEQGEHCNCSGPSAISSYGCCLQCGVKGSRYGQEKPACDHRYRGLPPHFCIRCAEPALGRYAQSPAATSHPQSPAPEPRPCPLCSQRHPACLFAAGSLYCQQPECSNPHHRPDPDRLPDITAAGLTEAGLKARKITSRKDPA
jgi:hypothetical protein